MPGADDFSEFSRSLHRLERALTRQTLEAVVIIGSGLTSTVLFNPCIVSHEPRSPDYVLEGRQADAEGKPGDLVRLTTQLLSIQEYRTPPG